MCDTDWFWLQFQSPKNVDTLMQIVQLFWTSEASWLINYMLKIVMKYLSSMYLHGYSGNFLFLLQTSGIATHNTVNDAHLKQAEQWFSLGTFLPVSVVMLYFHSEQVGSKHQHH